MLSVDIEKIIPVTEARDMFNKIVDEVEGTEEMYVLTKNGKPAAVIVGVNHLEKLTGSEGAEVMAKIADMNQPEAAAPAADAFATPAPADAAPAQTAPVAEAPATAMPPMDQAVPAAEQAVPNLPPVEEAAPAPDPFAAPPAQPVDQPTPPANEVPMTPPSAPTGQN